MTKNRFVKMATVLALVLSLMLGLLSVGSMAVEPCADGAHQPGSELLPKDYTPCDGGCKTDYYLCTVCGSPCDPDGNTIVRESGKHIPNNMLWPATYTTCGGGYKMASYECEVCGGHCDADGNTVAYENGNGQHTPGGKLWPADYTECRGGYKADHYYCTVCGNAALDIDGNEIISESGTGRHTPGEKFAADYTPCGGGYKTDFYECVICHTLGCDADGNEIPYERLGDGTPHTVGEKHAADYTPCGGGIRTEYYDCAVCGCHIDAEGYEHVGMWEPNDGTPHTPGGELHAADFTVCSGGHKEPYYVCTVCGYNTDAAGNLAQYTYGNGQHTIVSVPEKAPTYDEDGYKAHYECTVCHYLFRDEQASMRIYNEEDILLPRLTVSTVVKTENLTAVPESVASQYTTLEAVQTALRDSAKDAGADLTPTGSGAVTMDVTLQLKNADGSLTPVTPENFPAEGVTTVLPYPVGTDSSYTFVITHMITYGDKAGQIEVLSGTNTADGIRVHFTSMSPVCIAYTPKAEAPAPAPAPAPAHAAPTSNVPKTSGATHAALWGMLTLLSTGGLGALGLGGKKLRK